VPADRRRGPVVDAVVLPERRAGDGPAVCRRSKIELELQPIYERKKGEKHKTVATYDGEFRALFDRKITEKAIDFMARSNKKGKPFYMYLPYTQVHNPTIPDPEYVGKTKHGNWADV
jgi:hypothetical protein